MASIYGSKDVVLNVEVSPVDCLYRISRVSCESNLVVYVTVIGDGVIPVDDRTEGSLIIKNLQKLDVWQSKTWRTLRVCECNGEVKYKTDIAPPHAVMGRDLGNLPLYDILSLEVISQPKHRTSRVKYGGKDYFMKISPFYYQLGYLTREIKTYHFLANCNSALTPKLMGYVYEENPERVIGFLIEVIEGRHPDIGDITRCKEALQSLHSSGVLHGDANRYNILITPTMDVKFIDFECSSLAESLIEADILATQMIEELESLCQKIGDQGELGRPFTPEAVISNVS